MTHVDEAHDAVIAADGGDPSTLNAGLVASATMSPRSGYYRSLAELAAVYAHGIAKNHGYQDGNKRTATLVMLKFLGGHGFDLELPASWVETMVGVAVGTISRDELVGKITELMGGDPIVLED